MTLDYRTMLTLDAVNLITAVFHNEEDDRPAERIVGLYYSDPHELLHLLQCVTGIAASMCEHSIEAQQVLLVLRDGLLERDGS